ncbi:radical SAM protein [Candidatus Woesearchaeota archaeon]|nr:radical SAM protein [Candidatus Woesearchaeota archaeon]
MSQFLPVNLQEGKQYYQNFKQFDVVFITGDPYYDHPLSGMSIIARLLDSKGYKVGIIPQPETDEEFQACGQPKYFFCITSGLLDSMLANYTPMLHKRENVLVPERALITYTTKVKTLFKGVITVLGGVEATIRRFTHFDYKENTLRRGILHDTKADMLIFANAERAILTLLQRMSNIKKESDTFAQIRDKLDLSTIDGTSYRIKKEEIKPDIRVLPSFEQCVANKEDFSLLTRLHYLLPDAPFIEPTGVGFIQHNRPEHTLTQEEMDLIYNLPFTRDIHPHAKNREFNVQMVEKLAASVIIGRGCWGSCNFCIIPLVQGKEVAKRSKESIVKEIESMYAKGTKRINDLTLPTLNMYGSYCDLYDHPQEIYSPLINKTITVYNKTEYCNQQCVGCSHRQISDDLMPILEEVEKLNQKYQHTSLELRSAIRHDIILDQKKLFRKIMQFTTRLKIAPEHISDKVLASMNKARRKEFELFLEEFKKVNQEQGTRKRLVPYFVAAHPGSTQEDMDELKRFCEDKKLFVNLTQVFTPTPGTASTATYYTGIETRDKKKVYVPRTFREKKDQKYTLFSKEEHDRDDESG